MEKERREEGMIEENVVAELPVLNDAGEGRPERKEKAENRYRFRDRLTEENLDLRPLSIDTLQINVGKLCNQACLHCHVDAGPKRTEMIDRRTAERAVEVIAAHPQIRNVDITGGAPELSEHFRYLVEESLKHDRHVMVRHNLTVQFDPHPITGEKMSWLPEFYRDNECEVICSLPYYASYFTDRQRGRGVFDKSIEGLRRLNGLGYGMEGTGLILNLVYNPAGAFLPAAQESLEADYRRELLDRFGIHFSSLFTITNLPIHRFRHDLERRGALEEYMERLLAAFNPTAAEGVMCRTMISVDYDGTLSDCDFNQMLGISLGGSTPKSIFDFDADAVLRRRIVFADHCYGCTAGAGSSCGGTTT